MIGKFCYHLSNKENVLLTGSLNSILVEIERLVVMLQLVIGVEEGLVRSNMLALLQNLVSSVFAAEQCCKHDDEEAASGNANDQSRVSVFIFLLFIFFLFITMINWTISVMVQLNVGVRISETDANFSIFNIKVSIVFLKIP